MCLCCSSPCLLALLGAPVAHPLLSHPPAPPYEDFPSPYDVDGSFELREDMGPDRLQAVEDWLRVEGFAFRFRQRRWRVWTWPDRPGEGLRPDGIEEDEKPNEYPSGATINVSMWDMIEKNFCPVRGWLVTALLPPLWQAPPGARGAAPALVEYVGTL